MIRFDYYKRCYSLTSTNECFSAFVGRGHVNSMSGVHLVVTANSHESVLKMF